MLPLEKLFPFTVAQQREVTKMSAFEDIAKKQVESITIEYLFFFGCSNGFKISIKTHIYHITSLKTNTCVTRLLGVMIVVSKSPVIHILHQSKYPTSHR